MMAVVLLLAAMTVVVKALGWVGTQRRESDRRLFAVQEVSNVMERLAAEPYERVTAARARELAAGGLEPGTLPGSEWQAEVADEPGGPAPSKRVTLRLRWRVGSGEWGAPVRLTSWIYRGGDRS
jgi:hypothetical protein